VPVAQIHLTIESDFKAVFLVGRALQSLCALTALSELDTYQVELAVVEAVNNVIEHAYGQKPGYTIEVHLVLHHGKITVTIADTGTTMRPQLLSQDRCLPDIQADDVQQLPEGGWGLSIMQQIMDELTYSTVDGKNVLVLRKNIPPG
jgi:serine/threonine-protein kinase RsbW